MADLRIVSYLPNPRLYKATIAARYSGATLEVVGAKPPEMPGWLWDYDARPIDEAERDTPELERFARTARRGFQGKLYKTDRFLEANPFGDIPAAFGDDGALGLFESNSIMRAAARLGPNAAAICGDTPLEQSRIDAFLDRTLLFARDIQPYLFSAGKPDAAQTHATMRDTFESYLEGIERALSTSDFIAGSALSLADIVFACELALLSNEGRFLEQLEESGLEPLMPRLPKYEIAAAHLGRLAAEPNFAEDLGPYFARMGVAS